MITLFMRTANFDRAQCSKHLSLSVIDFVLRNDNREHKNGLTRLNHLELYLEFWGWDCFSPLLNDYSLMVG